MFGLQAQAFLKETEEFCETFKTEILKFPDIPLTDGLTALKQLNTVRDALRSRRDYLVLSQKLFDLDPVEFKQLNKV